jgi:hypothetical protein
VAKIEIPDNNHKGYAIIGCYLTSNNNANNEFESDLSQIATTKLRLKNLKYKTIVVGDLNADSGRGLYKQDKILAEWLANEDLIELTRLFVQPIPYTYLSSRGSMSCIDHIIVERNEELKEISDVNIVCTVEEYTELRLSKNWESRAAGIWDWENNFSDHRAISIGLGVKISTTELNKNTVRKKRLDWSKIDTQVKFSETVKILIEGTNMTSKTKVSLNEQECEKEIDSLNQILAKAEQKLLSKIGIGSYGRMKQKKNKSWWCKLLGILVKLRNRAYKEFTYTSHPIFKRIHSKLNSRIKRLGNKRKKYVKWLERQNMINNFKKNPNRYWRDLNNKRGAKVEIDIDAHTLRNKYKDNFNSLKQTRSSLLLQQKMEEVINLYEQKIKASKAHYPICADTIESILKDLKNNKCPGKNKITNEMLKYSRTHISGILKAVFESMINGCFCPNNINISFILTIIKDPKGNPTCIDNTRPITISEPISMILEELVMRDVARKCTLNKHQFGFRPNSSCGHAIFSIKEIGLDARKKGINAIALFLDFSKAFDKVNRTKLWYALITNSSPKYWLLLRNYYNKMKTYIIDNHGNFTEPYESSVGVKQGGKLSPFLYNLLVNELLNIIEKSKLTYKINDLSKGILVYADDTNIICDSAAKVRQVIKLIERFCSDFDITINAKKTKWMRLTPNYSVETEIIQIGGVIIEEVKEFKFLGVIICSNGSPMAHYKERRKLFFKGISEINNLGFSEADTPTRMKKLLYTSLVRSKLVYGMETCIFKANDSRKLLSTLESNQIKRANNLSTNSKSKILLYAIGISPLETYLLKRKIGFLRQLANNEATSELLIAGKHESLKDIIEYLKLDHGDRARLGPSEYLRLICKKCNLKLKEIEGIESKIRKCEIVRCIQYLLNHRNKDNDDTTQFLLDPRRYSSG